MLLALALPLQAPGLSSTPGSVNPHNGVLIKSLATKAGIELSWLTISCVIVTQQNHVRHAVSNLPGTEQVHASH